ncbi:MAG: hypothetical protein GKS01_16705 [Alphaproteobacteria bacterium]|nr:hypothetical protein [Alphaproteobacteria bacterium]
MTLLFAQCARGLAITVAAILLSGCTSFSTFFKDGYPSVEASTQKQQRLGQIQLRVAETALAHRDYKAAISLYEEAANNQRVRQTALLGLGKLHGLMGNRYAEREAYRAILKTNPDHTEAGNLLSAFDIRKRIETKGSKSSKPTSNAPAQPRNIVDRDRLNRPVMKKAYLDSELEQESKTQKSRKMPRKQRGKRNSLEKRLKNVRDRNTIGENKKGDHANNPISTNKADQKLYRVQMAAYRYKTNAVKALSSFNALVAKNHVQFELLVRNGQIPNNTGIHYRIRTKAMITVEKAKTMCKVARSAGQKCLVIKHNQRMWRSSA